MNLKPIRRNMTELDTGTNRILFSYEIPVAACIGGTYYRTQEHFNNTTSRHISEWLDGREAVEKPQSFFDTLAKEQP